MRVGNPSLVCQPRSYYFLTFFSAFSWPASTPATWQHVVESGEPWQGELARLCTAMPRGWKPVARPAEFRGTICQRVPLFFKVVCQFISIKAVKPKIKSWVFEDMLLVWDGATYKCPAQVMHSLEGQRQWRSKNKQVGGRILNFQWDNWQMFLVSQCNDIWF